MKIYVLLFLGILFSIYSYSQEFARGADVGWLSEMEASNKKFYNDQGQEQNVLEILKDHCINSIRLRVWVDPAGGWCGKNDVVAMAKRAANMGFRLMIDFHYSDNWADPSKQYKPASWENYSVSQLSQAIYDHTYDVLSAIKAEGVTPEWVQIGNETNNGMLWEDGKANPHMNNYATFVKSGHTAAKAVFPNIITIVHVSNGWDSDLFSWNIGGLVDNGALFDAIGMSLYPEPNSWQTMTSQALSNMQALISKYGKPIVISEIGMSYSYPAQAKAFVEDIIQKNMGLSNNMGLGVFWWEPESYNWRGYDKGAWGLDGKPTIALDGFMFNCNAKRTDCNGDEEGTAYRDACGNCVGGNTGEEECSSVQVTFKINIEGSGLNSTPYITGDMTTSGANWNIDLMNLKEEYIYTKTYEMWPGTSGGYYYLSANDWSARETVPAECIGMYEADRGYTIGYSDTTIAADWAGCTFSAHVPEPDCFGTPDGTAYLDYCGNCVGGETGREACFEQTIYLTKGWNLVSFGMGGEAVSFNNIFANADIQSIKTFDSFWEKGTQDYFNSINNIEQGKGYYIFLNDETKEISFEVIPSADDIATTALTQGWNLVGTPVENPYPIKNLPEEVIMVKDFESFWDSANNSGSLSELQSGKAYILYSEDNCTINWAVNPVLWNK